MAQHNPVETMIERGLFASRWLMAPMYIGLVIALMVLLYAFMGQLWQFALNLGSLSMDDAVMGVLALIDLSLAANLLLIVIFSGYENFVSKMDVGDHVDRPEWQGSVDFSTLKLKLVASIVAISGIHLLKVFMDVGKYPVEKIKWMIIIHVVFVISGVLLALMDFIAMKAKGLKGKKAEY